MLPESQTITPPENLQLLHQNVRKNHFYSATSRRSASVSFSPWRRMLPLVSALTIASGANVASAAGFGARESAAGLT